MTKRGAVTVAAFLVTYLGMTSWGNPGLADDLKVKAMSFNIRLSKARDGRNGWHGRADMVRGVIDRHRPDFVGVQEAWPDQIEYLQEALPGHGHLARSREADAKQGEAVPLLYDRNRWELDASQHGTFWLSDTPDLPGSKSWGNFLPRVATWARFIEKQSGRGVYVFNLHLDPFSDRSRVRSAALIAERITERCNPEPVIVMGDLNAGENGSAIRYFKGQIPGNGTPLVDTFRQLHPGASAGTFHAFTGISLGRKIDYVFTLPDAKVLDAKVLRDNVGGRYPSDHFPVLAELAFPERDPNVLKSGVLSLEDARPNASEACVLKEKEPGHVQPSAAAQGRGSSPRS